MDSRKVVDMPLYYLLSFLAAVNLVPARAQLSPLAVTVAQQPESGIFFEQYYNQSQPTFFFPPQPSGYGAISNTAQIVWQGGNPSATPHWSLHQYEGNTNTPYLSNAIGLGLASSGVSYSQNSGNWSVGNPNEAVAYTSSSATYQLSQNSGNDGSTMLACGNEFDLFALTLNADYYSNSNFPLENSYGTALATATALEVKLGLQITNESTTPNCAGGTVGTDWVGYLVALVFSNDAQEPAQNVYPNAAPTTDCPPNLTTPPTLTGPVGNYCPRQTLFYQIFLRNSRYPTATYPIIALPDEYNLTTIPCPNPPSVPTCGANGTWNVDSDVDEFTNLSTGQKSTMAQPGSGVQSYDFDALPAIRNLIQNPSTYMTNNPGTCFGTQNGAGCFDSNILDWRLTAVYFGQAMGGQALGTSQWNGLQVLLHLNEAVQVPVFSLLLN